MLTLGLWSCARPEPDKREQPDENCPELYQEPDRVTDYSVPDEHGWLGVIEPHPDWGQTCVLSASPGDWCRAYLPCWDASDCPDFEEFIEVIGWLDEDADYIFTDGQIASYNPSFVSECDTRIGFHVDGATSMALNFHFSSDTQEVEAISRAIAGDVFQCVGGEALLVWWGDALVLGDEDCEKRYRSWYELPSDSDTATEEAGSTSGCGCSLPAVRGPSWSWSLCLVVAWAGRRRVPGQAGPRRMAPPESVRSSLGLVRVRRDAGSEGSRPVWDEGEDAGC